VAEVVLSRAQRESLVREASRAPSVHNVQPARWRFGTDGSVTLFRALDRVLPVADPTGHDVAVSLGAAFEGLAIALSRMGLTLGAPTPEREERAGGCEAVVRATITPGGETDQLAPWVRARRSHRGKFAAPRPGDRAAIEALGADDVRIVTMPDEIRAIAPLHDAATWTFESRAEYHAELWSWLRLSPSDPRYRRDGLNADCLALTPLERRAARLLLRPASFALLTRLGVAKSLIAESPQVQSAAAVVLFTPRGGDEPFDVGRRFYRLWLSIAAAGLCAVPMSASADDPGVRGMLATCYGIPDDLRIANVLRVGRAPKDGVAESGRLPVEELMV
jgi:hypothetical protein